jgi:hypothetical protein
MNPNLSFIKIPIVILIFQNQEQVIYKAYSPNRYDFPFDPSNPSFETTQYNNFINRVYRHVGYNFQDSITNITNYGKLMEIHIRHISTPLSYRGQDCYFTVLTNQNINYSPVHHASPIFFNEQEALSRSPEQIDLQHMCCHHEFV